MPHLSNEENSTTYFNKALWREGVVTFTTLFTWPQG